VFSDSIVITTKDDSEPSFLTILERCSAVFGTLLQHEIAVRGAIAHGTFITSKTNSGTFVAGRAIIEAYQFEENQDWIGVMLAPSVVQKIPNLSERCKYEEPYTDEIMRRLNGRLPWVAYMQSFDSIPFHGGPLETTNYDGFAIVPSDAKFDPVSLRDSLAKSLESLARLKSIAPNPQAQQKYQRTIEWLVGVYHSWNNVLIRREELAKRSA
jgi:hypothetical protein